MAEKTVVQASNFVRNIIAKDVRKGNNDGQVVTRFPPEPNGYLHVGHATSICLNFGMAQEFKGQCNLRFDDTNPEKESDEFIQSIKRDVEWLGFEWGTEECYASNYFDQLHSFAIELINKGLAYVCDLSPEQAREYRGNLTQVGKNSPHRERSIEENLDLFARMKAKEVNKTIERLDNQDWDRMKKHMDEKFPNMKVPNIEDFKELVKLYGIIQSYNEGKLN